MMKATDGMYKHLINLDGIEGTINGKIIKFLITEDEITTDEPLYEGSFINIDENNYLVTEIKNKINHSLYFIGVFKRTLPILLGSNYKPVQAIVDRDKITLVDSTYFQEVHDQYTFIIPKLGNKTGEGETLVYDLGVYKIISIDSSKEGILILTGKFDSVYTPHTYTITLNSNSELITETGNFQLISTVTDNLETVTSPQLTYVSSNTSVATVDAQGLISAIGIGECIITVSYKNSISATCSVTIIEKPSEPVISYSYTWSNGSTGLKYYSSTTFTATKLIDGVIDPSLVIAFEWDSIGASLVSGNKVTMTKKTDASWTIKNTNVSAITNCILTWKDAITGAVIYSAPFQFRYMS